MRILFTNSGLVQRAGTELAVLDLARRFKRKGHLPVAYSQDLGEVARELQHAGIPVIDDLDALQEPPDVIHGHHHIETMAACLHFPNVPAIYVCNGWKPWQELPPTFATIMAYVAVGDVTRERIVTSVRLEGRPIGVVPTFFDEELFLPRQEIPTQPKRAVLYNNNLTPSDPLAREIALACRRRHISLDIRGADAGNATRHPDELLSGYDVVFAVGRSAVEAMACGCAVIVCDKSGAAGMAVPGDFSSPGHNKLNLFERSPERVNSAYFGEQLDRYDAKSIARLRDEIRDRRSLAKAVAQFEAIYDGAIGRFSGVQIDSRQLLLEASKYISSLGSILKKSTAAAAQAESAARLEKGAQRSHRTSFSPAVSDLLAPRRSASSGLPPLR